MPSLARFCDVVNAGVGRATQAETAAPALFHLLVLGSRPICAISGFSLTARAEETRAILAANVRPEIQKVRIC